MYDEYGPPLCADGVTQQCCGQGGKPHCGAVTRSRELPCTTRITNPQMQSAEYADPNDELTRLLRLGAEPVPFDAVDWDSLRARIQQGDQVKQIDTSELSWWRFTAHWSRVLVPVSAAAAIVALALLSSAPAIGHHGLSGAAGNDALLQAAISGSDVHGGALDSSDVTDWFATEYTKSR